MKLARPKQKPKQESTIALINIVFLMLIFFLVAGTLAPPLDPEISLVETEVAEPTAPSNALSMRKDGSTVFRGEVTSIENFIRLRDDSEASVQVVVDQSASAAKLLSITQELQQLTKKPVNVITRRVQK